ncbi:hypothetical protein SLEP1_g8094 [Rubroshorea leprosula]|uniref:Uncharacterized protein n=1 Tax=Rubroshorea leprosula TaxID=152421 RepID=A0AAV5I533_9ROSI|nr:hypothetical protein SLEP1_g8094 [Rubroshorea leprosula]
MCFRVDCKQCGKYSWGGCGKHLSTLYASIDKGKHCMCRSWPAVVVPSDEKDPKQLPPPHGPPSAPTSGKEKSLLQ